MHRMIETDDYYPISVLYHDSGLEVDISHQIPETVLKMWRCENADGELLAAMSIEKRSGVFVLGGLAVTENMRGTGLGKELLALAEQEAKEMDAEVFWLVGKVPAFYRQYGWKDVDRSEAPVISKCMTCRQFGESCFPVVMKKTL